jgi:hypothetical protein
MRTSGTPMQGADFPEALVRLSIGSELPNEELKIGLPALPANSAQRIRSTGVLIARSYGVAPPMIPGIRYLAGAAVFALGVAIGTSGEAATCGDVQFADALTVNSSPLVLNGLGVREATMFNVDVYVAGLYVPQKSVDGDAIIAANQPWRLLLKFVHDADASDVRDAFQKGFERVTGGNLGPLKDRIATLDSQIVDIKEGDYLSLTYDPVAASTVIDLNGMSSAPIEGADFADALLTMSVGPNTPNQQLRAGLLGGPCESPSLPDPVGDD